MKRVFIAIKIDLEHNVLSALQNIKTTLGNEKIRWVNYANMHLTLKFLGDTEEETIIDIYEAMQNSEISQIPAFKLELESIGLFKSIYKPRVIWIGIKSSDYLEKIFKELQNALQNLNIKREEKKFSPHLTIGRMKYIYNTQVLQSVLNDYKKTVFQVTEINKIIVYESILQKTGPVYNELYHINLA
ncbi:MAG: RNA 2',3'-cyclic phosphodiesterase [Chlorobi bacterium]|nr:RNA 2',3'-cyclic phosphodiesterase [Chlorobiota bacterium]